MKQNKALIEQLREFGLNPRFWILKRLKKTQNWILIHKQDHDMCLLGQTQTGTRWKQLEWLI